ncbi:MAG: heparan-alpha-glucosaminide N-acetyltransferase [Bacteroidetes bacterium]|nr:MAG: heparan-alpha-glucosaminide N-acetyltransferase [Bacteroidota bacterium]
MTQSKRLISLDALRGFTIAAMVVVNDPGSWQHVYWPLLHAKWNGCTLTDLVFPFFLFMVGVSIALAYTKRLEAGVEKKKLYQKIILRSFNIYILGIFLYLFPSFDFQHIRWVGVLPRIAFVFLACALLFLNTNWKQQIKIGAVILVLYWIVVAYLPVPGLGKPDLSVPDKNWANYLDQLLVPGVLYRKTWDPEGFLSTFPAIVSGIIGMLVGTLYLKIRDEYKRLTWLYLAGFSMFLAGGLWNWFFPINKHIWTSSYVLYTSGLGTLSLATCILLVDMLGYKRWTFLGRVYGANAITSYVLAGMLTLVFYRMKIGEYSMNQWFMNGLSAVGFDPRLASLCYALLYMLLIFIPALILYRKKIFIRI